VAVEECEVPCASIALDLRLSVWQTSARFMGNSFGQPPSGISGTAPFSGPPESNRLRLDFGDGLSFGGGEVDTGVDGGLDADDDVLAEPPGLGEPDGAEALHSSTVTLHLAFADSMLR
jgi:hypothetical protein